MTYKLNPFTRKPDYYEIPTSCKFMATASAAQTVPTASWTLINFDTEVYDIGSGYDTTNKRWVPGIVGKGHIDVFNYFAATADQTYIIIGIFKNGGVYKQSVIRSSGTSDQGTQVSTDIVVDNVADYFDARIYQNSGSGQTTSSATNVASFNGHMLL